MLEPIEPIEHIVTGGRANDFFPQVLAGGNVNNLNLHIVVQTALLRLQRGGQTFGIAGWKLEGVVVGILVAGDADQKCVELRF